MLRLCLIRVLVLTSSAVAVPQQAATEINKGSGSSGSVAILLKQLDTYQLPTGYEGTRHQAYVDDQMETLSPLQRGRVATLWKQKRELQPEMENAGHSFVKILAWVAAGEKPPSSVSEKTRHSTDATADKSGPTIYDDSSATTENSWGNWRGPEVNGVSRTAIPPLEWSEEKGIRWKVDIDGKGTSTPIVWGEKVFVLTVIDTGKVDPSLPKPKDQPKRVFGITHPNTWHRYVVICLDRNTGMEIWRRTSTERIPHEGTHRDADFASSSPTTDGKRLYCWFGSGGMYCYDMHGQLQWERDLGKSHIGASLGEGCSPVLYDGKLVVVRDHSRQSSIEVLDAATGDSLWKKNRDEPNAWATPRVVEHSSKTQIITAASNMVRSYNLDDGEIIWQCSGLTGNCTPCPVVEGDVVYCMSGYEGHALLALPLTETGDISESGKIVWSKEQGTPYVPSPVLYDGLLYFTQSNNNILTCLKSKTGDTVLDRTRLTGISNIYASPVGADGRIYFTGRNGTTLVLKRSMELEILATNKLNDEFNASPAIVGRQLFLRGRKALYCIEEESSRRE